MAETVAFMGAEDGDDYFILGASEAELWANEGGATYHQVPLGNRHEMYPGAVQRSNQLPPELGRISMGRGLPPELGRVAFRAPDLIRIDPESAVWPPSNN